MCNKKRELHLKYRVTNDNSIKLHYKRHCKLFSKVIKDAKEKKLHYDKMILISKNKMETMWKVIKTKTCKTNKKLGVQSLKINNTVTDNHILFLTL